MYHIPSQKLVIFGDYSACSFWWLIPCFGSGRVLTHKVAHLYLESFCHFLEYSLYISICVQLSRLHAVLQSPRIPLSTCLLSYKFYPPCIPDFSSPSLHRSNMNRQNSGADALPIIHCMDTAVARKYSRKIFYIRNYGNN